MVGGPRPFDTDVDIGGQSLAAEPLRAWLNKRREQGTDSI
jgi:hypothetical protein